MISRRALEYCQGRVWTSAVPAHDDLAQWSWLSVLGFMLSMTVASFRGEIEIDDDGKWIRLTPKGQQIVMAMQRRGP